MISDTSTLQIAEEDIALGENERIDDLLLRGRKIIQNTKEFCFSIDAVLLAHYPQYHANWRVMDLGTGTGVMPLLIADKVREIHGIELNPVMVDLARRNVTLNQLQGKITIKSGDYRNIRDIYPAECFDCVIANPPYRPVADGTLSALKGVASARHELTATLKDVVRAARYLLKFRGRFAMVHLPERLGEIVVAMHENQIEIKRLQLVQPKPSKPSNLLLVEGVVGGASGGMKAEVPLIIHREDGTYTDEVLSIYNLSRDGKASCGI
ncbi:MAG: methyltransferase domain-containing protein [Anaerovibrio sp.]|uniref:tRNA1(Val) (adenine(37)-N6)-methyltransferase n=1 Tax=Anaerovibrio sp. TaxID=1872532 RepID=UPI0025CFA823|nr:methyltransferase domain-containing protein [Anaerovibrio sp.]MCR5177171.1 methyltransferase domain-containing protein [Anaerovibrio sp.]